MIIVKIIGGLGNQMFQYAYAKALEQRGNEVKIDITVFETYKLHGGYQLDKYDIDLKESSVEENNRYYSKTIFSKILRKVGVKSSTVIREKSLLFDDTFLNIEDDDYIEGYFQSEKYFKNIRDILLEQFSIKQNLSNYTTEIEKKIIKTKNSCSIHIRRGDFVNTTNINIHGNCDLVYYKKAISSLEDRIGKLKFFIFSDDIEWCKQNLEINNTVYIDSKEKRIPHEDIYLMSLCGHNIIANSSFSWWGAWLNKNEDKIVIPPKRWFADEKLDKESMDIVCEKWLKI